MWFIHPIQCRLKTGTTKGRLMRLLEDVTRTLRLPEFIGQRLET